MLPPDFTAWITEYNRLYKALDELYRSAAARFNLPECALWILYTLRLANGPLTQRELCDRLFLPKQSVHTALKKLIAQGYLTLSFREGNRKSKWIHLTDTGLRLARKSADLILQAEARAHARLSPGEQAQLPLLTHRFTTLLQEEMTFLPEGDAL